MPRSHQRPQQVRELFAKLYDVVALGFEQLQQRAQMRCRERRTAAVVGLIAVDKLVHPATEVLRVQLAEIGLVVQVITPRPGLRHYRLDAPAAPGFRARPGGAEHRSLVTPSCGWGDRRGGARLHERKRVEATRAGRKGRLLDASDSLNCGGGPSLRARAVA